MEGGELGLTGLGRHQSRRGGGPEKHPTILGHDVGLICSILAPMQWRSGRRRLVPQLLIQGSEGHGLCGRFCA
jgi:hypothetical protein